MIINYQIAVLLAVTAYVYTQELTKPNQLFNGLYKKLYVFFKNDERESMGKPLHPLFMILIGCHKCVGGQMAFWYYIIFHYDNYFLPQHVFFIAFTILSTIIINKLLNNNE